VNNQEIHSSDSIKNSDLQLTLTSYDKNSSKVHFQFKNLKTGQEESFQFSLKYWASQISYDQWSDRPQNSGDYVFMPMVGQKEANDYSEYRSGTISLGEHGQQMDFHFAKTDSTNAPASETALVHVSIDSDLAVLRFDVDLGSLPTEEYGGFELVADFQIDNFDNNMTFATDSNGLEMQTRILNYRPTWNIETNYNRSNDNITANFYPVNSAISIKDGDRVFTVMNDRAQAGASLAPGNIQLMQNRRIEQDDGKGMGEWLDEKDANGNGIRVPATYFVQIFNQSAGPSLQRLVQHKQDDPAQYFFAFDLEKTGAHLEGSSLSQDLKDAGVAGEVTMVAFPLDRNKILVRLENLADRYDVGAASKNVSLRAVLHAFWTSANQAHSQEYSDLLVEEMSLTANMKMTEMLERKVHWRTADDEKWQQMEKDGATHGLSYGPSPNSSTEDQLLLEPQRIRVFSATFKPSDKAKEAEGPLFMQE